MDVFLLNGSTVRVHAERGLTLHGQLLDLINLKSFMTL